MHSLITFVERFKLTTKLAIGLSLGIVVALLIGINSLTTLTQIETEIEKMYENDLLGISHVKDANLNLIYMSRAMRHALIAQDEETRNTSLATIKRAREKLMVDLAEARKRMYRPETITRYDEFQRDLTKALEGIEHATLLIQKEGMFSSAAAKFITGKEFGTIIAKADGGLHELTEIKERAAGKTLDELRAQADITRRNAVLLLLTGVILAGLLGTLIGLSILRPNERIRAAVERLAGGKVDGEIPHTDFPNEIGIMARALAVLQDIYRKSDEQHWVKSHVAEINAAIQQAEDFRSLAQAAISRLAPAIEAGHGAYYVADTAQRFSLLASYGYRERKGLSNSFAIGEGLVGQCVLEKSAIMLTAPKDYIRIGSGLGEGPPACIMVLPVIHGERVLGVLEMAAFRPFNSREQAVLEAVLPALATSMEILDRNLRTKELLAATKEQAERMEKQAAQLEEQTVEMEAQQAELLETENWFRSIIDASPDGLLVVDAGGRILLSNPALDALFGYAPGELANTEVDQLVPDASRGGHRERRAQFMADERSRKMADGVDLTGRRKDGTELAIRVSLSQLPPRGGRGKCVSVTVRPARKVEQGI